MIDLTARLCTIHHMNTREEICSCGVCGNMLYRGENLADHKKYEFDGEIDYIELAHVHCAVEDNARRGDDYWEYGSHYADDPRLDEPEEPELTDADVLHSIGWGTDEDYGDFIDDYF